MPPYRLPKAGRGHVVDEARAEAPSGHEPLHRRAVPHGHDPLCLQPVLLDEPVNDATDDGRVGREGEVDGPVGAAGQVSAQRQGGKGISGQAAAGAPQLVLERKEERDGSCNNGGKNDNANVEA